MIYELSLYFSLPICLVQISLGLSKVYFSQLCRLFQMFSGKLLFVILVRECSQWFAPCCKPFVATFMKISLDCRH